MDIQQLRQYECRINIRESFNGQPVKKAFKAIDGMILTLKALWPMDDSDKYPNEWVMELPDYNEGMAWIASGDVELINVVN